MVDAVPRCVAALGGEPRVVWTNELHGVTYVVGDRFVKWSPMGAPDLGCERVRLEWARAFVCVPEVIDHGEDDEGSWLMTRAIEGDNAVAPRWIAEPAVAVRAIGTGLRAFHDALPVDGCPFSWSVEERLADIDRRADRIRPEKWHEDHRVLELASARQILADAPPVDRLVVCHGDTCAPNTLLTDDGRCAGHVDLGALGIADRWADLAIATWSLDWNYGAGWAPVLLDAYGVAADDERTRYYRLLWDLGP